ncbi:class I tRNA ligase family protein, partial [Salibaculum sp.]|uniref:class I tRNA ligase family protein n=1 Tax=Salibaculum sp. TaxID=2855480 RepID=UPI002B474802
EVFDIHGGGNDLMFPHHENEIAQSCCANDTEEMARVWMHNEMLQVEGKKMSKSLGNFFTVRDLLDQGVPGEVIRFVMLSTHYRKPMDWTQKKREEAEKTLRKWRMLVRDIDPDDSPSPSVIDLLSDDLNTWGVISKLHHFADEGDFRALKASAQIMGLLLPESDSAFQAGLSSKVRNRLAGFRNRLTEARKSAMMTKDFSEVDRLKADLIDAGVEVRMSKEGVELVPGPGFDPAKLEASHDSL